MKNSFILDIFCLFLFSPVLISSFLCAEIKKKKKSEFILYHFTCYFECISAFTPRRTSTWVILYCFYISQFYKQKNWRLILDDFGHNMAECSASGKIGIHSSFSAEQDHLPCLLMISLTLIRFELGIGILHEEHDYSQTNRTSTVLLLWNVRILGTLQG